MKYLKEYSHMDDVENDIIEVLRDFLEDNNIYYAKYADLANILGGIPSNSNQINFYHIYTYGSILETRIHIFSVCRKQDVNRNRVLSESKSLVDRINKIYNSHNTSQKPVELAKVVHTPMRVNKTGSKIILDIQILISKFKITKDQINSPSL